MKDLRSESTDRLFEAVLKLNSIDDCYSFFEDLCTVKEIKDMSQRLDVALLISSGGSYQEIAGKTGVSTTTIARVKHCLEYGSGGYDKAIKSLNSGAEKENDI